MYPLYTHHLPIDVPIIYPAIRPMAKFDEIIEALDSDLLKEFHNKLIEGGFYTDIINPDVLVENDVNEIKRAVKTAVSNCDYVKLKEIAPSTLVQAIDALEPKPPQNNYESEHPEQIEYTGRPTGTDPQKTKQIIILSQKLITILDQRDVRGAVPAKLRKEFTDIITKLHDCGLTQEDIESRFNITRKTVGKTLNTLKKEKESKLLEMKLKESTGKEAKARLNAGVEGAFDTIEEHAKAITKTRMEEDYNLGNYLNEKYYLASLSKGITVQGLVQNATEAYLHQGDIYKLIMDMEDENIELTKQNRVLQAEIMRMNALNTNLRTTIINLNNY